MNWNTDRIAQLKELKARGLSAACIAAEMGGGITRNAVIGKLTRLGLGGGPRIARAPRRCAPKPAAPRPRPSRLVVRVGAAPLQVVVAEPAPRIELEPVAAPVIPFGQRCSLMKLREDTCRWPVGDPGTEDFFFCGGKRADGFPYCAWHARLAYLPLGGRRREQAAW